MGERLVAEALAATPIAAGRVELVERRTSAVQPPSAARPRRRSSTLWAVCIVGGTERSAWAFPSRAIESS